MPLVWDEETGALEADGFGDLFAGGEAETWVLPVVPSRVAKHRHGSPGAATRLLYPPLDPRRPKPGHRAQMASAALATVALLAGAVTVWATPSHRDRLTASGTRLSSDQSAASRAAARTRRKAPEAAAPGTTGAGASAPGASSPAPRPASSVRLSPSPSATPSSSSRSAAASPSASASSSSSRTASASPGAPATPSGSPPGGSALVTVAPGLSQNLAAPQVEGVLVKYFTAINDHNFGQYASLFIPEVRQYLTAAGFASGYQTTTDSHGILVGISASGPGVAAMVTFTSRQTPVPSAGVTACTNWAITVYLQPDGSGLLIAPPPAGYHASAQACG
jgi:hypothetical protein